MPELVKVGGRAQSGFRRAVSDYDAPLTAPSAQMVEPAPSTRNSASPVEENARVLGIFFKMKLDDCPRDSEATDALMPNMMRYSGRRELERGFRTSSSRMRHARPRASARAADMRPSRTDPVWLLRGLFQDKLMARHLAARPYGVFGSFPDADDPRGSLYDSGCVFQYAVRAQALLQLSVSAW